MGVRGIIQGRGHRNDTSQNQRHNPKKTQRKTQKRGPVVHPTLNNNEILLVSIHTEGRVDDVEGKTEDY